MATIGTFLLLAGVIYPQLIGDRFVSYCSALGVVLSFGVLSRGCAIEVYAPALLMDVALVAYCLVSDFTRPTTAIFAGILFALAIGIHVSNLMIGPLVVGLVIRRAGWARGGPAIGWAAAACLVGLLIMGAMLLAGRRVSLWPPDLAVLFPKGEPAPHQGLAARLARAVYGFSSTVAYLPAAWDLRADRAFAYAAAMATVTATIL